jgi:hypothetical protein
MEKIAMNAQLSYGVVRSDAAEPFDREWRASNEPGTDLVYATADTMGLMLNTAVDMMVRWPLQIATASLALMTVTAQSMSRALMGGSQNNDRQLGSSSRWSDRPAEGLNAYERQGKAVTETSRRTWVVHRY